MIAQFPVFVDKHMDHKDYNGLNPSKFTKLGLQKLIDIHLYSHTDYEAEPNGDIKRVYIFSIIALFILLIACINYMNLSTARSALRAREIGIRKVLRSNKTALVLQFLSETFLLVLFAVIISLGIVRLVLHASRAIFTDDLTINFLSPSLLVFLFLITIVTTLLAGFYPAKVLSSYLPVLLHFI
jgi:putative ABC transport system permease protein